MWPWVLLGALLSPTPAAFAAASHASPAAARAGARISAQLLERMAAAGPTGFVSFTAVLAEQSDCRRLRIEAGRVARQSGRRSGRAHAATVLKDLAARTQEPLREFLERERRAGRVREYRPLWIANAVCGSAQPAVLEELTRMPGVERVVWDPPVSADAQQDEVIPPQGRRHIPARSGSVSGSAPAEGLHVFGAGEDRDPEIGWNLEMIGAPAAWDQGYNGDSIVVGLIDSGVDYTHPDLVARMWHNLDEVPWNGVDDDENGFIDDTLGWDFVFDDNDPMGTGPVDHGTRAAGLVAGDGTSGIVTGVAPGASIMALKASGGGWGNIFEAIQYACDNGADVISMSVSQKWHDNPKPDYALWRQVTDNELAAGMFHANSIGNEGDNLDTDPRPFNVSAPGCVPSAWITPWQFISGGVSVMNAVGAVDSLLCLAEFSGRGPSAWEDLAATWPQYPYPMPEEYRDYPYSNDWRGLIRPDILAPGEDVMSTMQGGGYLSFTGTSAACPHGAGALAILLHANPEITPAQAAMVLQLSARDLGPEGKDDDFGAGLIDLVAALAMLGELDNFGTLEGVVTDAQTGDSLPGAVILLLETGATDACNAQGVYRLLTPPGLYGAEVRCFGYQTDTLEVTLAPGETRLQNMLLEPWAKGTVSGGVYDAESGRPIAGAFVEVVGTPLGRQLTGEDGAYAFADFPADTPLVVRAVHFGHEWTDSLATVGDSAAIALDFHLEHGVRDDFEVDQGWIVGGPSDTAWDGLWVRCDPNGIWDGPVPVQPEDDHTPDPGTHCYVTGNGLPGSSDYQNDVDRGWTTLTSPLFDGAWYYQPLLKMSFWYSNDTGFFVDDTLRIELTNDAGRTWVSLLVTHTSTHAWANLPIFIESVIELSDSMQVRIVASDANSISSVEVAVDDFEISGAPFSGAEDQPPSWEVTFLGPRPNPFTTGSSLTFRLREPAPVKLEIFDAQGRCVRTLLRGAVASGSHEILWDATDNAGRRCDAGAYFSRFTGPGGVATRPLILLR